MYVAIQGLPGSFHHIVAMKYFGSDVSLLHKDKFRDVFEAVAAGDAGYGLVATENTLYGSISDTMDLVEEFQLPIVGEHIEKIEHYLYGSAQATPDTVTHIYSQIMALRQCDVWLRTNYPDAELVEYYDTSAAVAMVASAQDPSRAAIGSKLAGELAGATVLASGIQDESSNMTKFVVLQKDGQSPADANMASLIVTTTHQPGALYQALGVFAQAQINISSIVSRPKKSQPWLYRFHMTVNAAGPMLHASIAQLRKQGCEVMLLGEYHHSND